MRKQYEKICLNSIENIMFFKRLIDEGYDAGHLKKFYGLRRDSYFNIKNDRIDFENDKVKCLICGKEQSYISKNHLRFCSQITVEEYFERYPNAKFISARRIIEQSNSIAGKSLSEEAKEKLRQRNLGRKHSAETLGKLSVLFSGDNNPAKRQDSKTAMRANHTAKQNPDKWKRIVKENGEKHRGYKFTPQQKENLLRAREHSSKYGSKVQIYVCKYLKKYFSLYYKVEVKSNDCEPFIGHTDLFSVDITIPEHKIAIEWDGAWHRKPIFGEDHLIKVQNNDKAKDFILKQRGWTVFRVIDDIKNDRHKTKNVHKECRKLIEKIKGIM